MHVAIMCFIETSELIVRGRQAQVAQRLEDAHRLVRKLVERGAEVTGEPPEE